MIHYGGRTYRTLNQVFYYGGERILSAYWGNIKVYPEPLEQSITINCGSASNGEGIYDNGWTTWNVNIGSLNIDPVVNSSHFDHLYFYVALIQEDQLGRYGSAAESYKVDMASSVKYPTVYKCDSSTGNYTIPCGDQGLQVGYATKYDASNNESANARMMQLRIKVGENVNNIYRMIKPGVSDIVKGSSISSYDVSVQGFYDVPIR